MKPGDTFYKDDSTGRIWRVHRVHRGAVFYYPASYGHNPPRGTLRKDLWEDLPAGTFAGEGTNVNAALVVFQG